jgi:cobalt-zinc-cadmium efflux system outer membrane protein
MGGVWAQAFFAVPALAEPAPSYAELLQQAEATAPRLAEARADVGQARGLADQAAMRPNPVVSLQSENFAGSRPFNGLDRAETTLSVEQPIELGGKRPARIAAGRAGVLAARARGAKARADFAFDLAEAYGLAEAAELRLQLAQDSLALAQEDGRVAEALVRAGKESDLRVVQVRAATEAARAEVDAARASRAAAFGRLSAMAGAPAAYTTIAVSLLSHAEAPEHWPTPDPLASPAYQSALAAREAVARRVRVEQTRATPDLTVSVGIRRLAGDGATAMVGGVSAPFPLFDRNRGNVSAAQAELAAADARLNAARLDAEADGHVLIVRLEAVQTRVVATQQGEAAAAEAYRLTRTGYEGGKLPLLELLSARRALTEARSQSLTALLERLGAEAELARLQGVAPFGDHT